MIGISWLAPGSGKFGTPCARMQSANIIPEETPLDCDPVTVLPDELHAASRRAQQASVATASGLVCAARAVWWRISVDARCSRAAVTAA
jgi:hypothetical protein